MLNLFYAQQALKEASSNLEHARARGNKTAEEKSMNDINFVCQEIAGTILEDLTDDELERIQVILDEAQNRIDNQELYNEMRFMNPYN